MTKEICPICGKNPTYRKERLVSDGYTKDNGRGGYYFVKIGVKKVVDEWWTCKFCAKNIPVWLYNKLCIEHFNKTKTCV